MKFIILSFFLISLAFAKDYPAVTQKIIDNVNSKKTSWRAGVNEIFKGKTLSQVRHLFGAFLVDPKTDRRPRMFSQVKDLPKQFDSRVQWSDCIHDIRDQGACGSCWAFSASEVLSDRFCIASKGKVNLVLSPQDLISCDKNDYGCEGGYLDKLWIYCQESGIVSDDCFAYESRFGEKVDCPWDKTPGKCFEEGETYKKYFAQKEEIKFIGDIQTAMQEIITNGPIQTGFQVYQDFFGYKDGVYYHVDGGFAGGHAVKVVGWGVDADSGLDYWIVANSWGTSWAKLKGYFWIKKGTDECQIESQMITGHADLTRL